MAESQATVRALADDKVNSLGVALLAVAMGAALMEWPVYM